jgi:hypothetical protein
MFGEIDGVPVKVLLDASSPVAFGDLKTCAVNSPKEWGEQVAAYDYDFQYVLYREIWKQNHEREPEAFYWVTVSAGLAPVVAIYHAENWFSYGMRKLNTVVQRLKELQETGEQPLTAEIPWWLLAQDRRDAK